VAEGEEEVAHKHMDQLDKMEELHNHLAEDTRGPLALRNPLAEDS